MVCKWVFQQYKPSDWETYWMKNIDTLQTKVCPTIVEPDQFNKSVNLIRKIIQYQKSVNRDNNAYDASEKLFSKMSYRYECEDKSIKPITVSQYIEPLTGLLRDPFTICAHAKVPDDLTINGNAAIQSKRFILLGPSAPHENYSLKPNQAIPPWLLTSGSRLIVVDLGASLFNGGTDPTVVTTWIGARWFYDYFKSKFIGIDQVLAFEYSGLDPNVYWPQIPEDLMGKLTLINVGVKKTGKFNPWNTIKRIAHPNDYVLVKLDIDNAEIENELINQVLNDMSVSTLIDEMFFEMHVNVTEMLPFWSMNNGTLKDSYTIFTKLRERGIRMHSWP